MSTRYLDYTGLTTLVGLIEDEISDVVAGEVSGIYTVKGSTTFEGLSLLESISVGDVYNVTDAFETDVDFVESEQGNSYPAGTNIVFTSDGWDVLAGMVDLSDYATTDYVSGNYAGIASTEVGSGKNPVYVTGGTVTASAETVGGTKQPVYMNAGTITATTETVGGASTPVYMNAGTITSTGYDLSTFATTSALDSYVATSDLVSITDAEIQALFA